jgi:hypothetical protein
MPVRRQQTREIKKVLGEGTYTTTNPQGQINVMRQYQSANLIPLQFETPNQLSDAVASKIAEGKTKIEALSELGINLPRSFFDSTGKLIGRKFRDTQSPALIEAWNKATGGLPAESLGKLERSEWSNEQKVLQEVGRRLGMKLDLGHFETSASGAPGNIAAAGAEYNLANQAAGRSLENPFRPQTQAEIADIGMATNKVQGLAEASLLSQDLPTRGGLTGRPLNPYISVLLGTTLSGQRSRLLPQENLETLNYTFDQLEKQGANPVAMYDYIRERAGEGININEMARAGQQQYDISKFSPKAKAPKAGPLKIVRPAAPNGPTVTTKGVPKGLMSKLGPIGAGLAIGGALLSDNPAEAIPVAAETLTPLGDLQGAPEPAVTMVNVNGKLRPLNTDTNTLMDKPGYGLEQKGGQWREVKRGTGAASKQQSRVQAEQLIPTPKPVMANTPTGVAQLKAMPKSKNIDLINEAQYFIVNPVRSAFDRIFGKRDI